MDAASLPLPATPAERRIPGNKGIWVGIYCELTEFALMFIVYFIARAHHPEAFRAGPQQLSALAGVTNTLIMLTSSYFVARALLAMRQDHARRCLCWLGAALLTGLGYPLVKYFELRWNVAHGLSGNGEVFQMTYYYLTFNHLVHVSWGLLGMLWVMLRTAMGAYSSRDHAGLEAFACYWHATDLIWLMIFPLFYVLH
ncbi:MAG: cytochrome c oxidase subunit 3 family protein [Rhodocyclaceae bacterium]|nr:cytochrome c oxidase subunit 3 family protein [Rhodocyclaceae bacterium]